LARFDQLDDVLNGPLAPVIRIGRKHLGTLYVPWKTYRFIVEVAFDDNFGFSRYAEAIGKSANSL